MATALRRSAGRSPVSQRGTAEPKSRGASPAPAHGSSWLVKAVAASVGLAGCIVLIYFLAAPSPSSSASGAAASLMSHLKGRKAQQDPQEVARLDAYCGAPLSGKEGPAHLPPASLASASSPPKLRQLQVVIRHGDRSPINSLTTPPPSFSCKLKDPAMVRLAQLMKEDGGDDGGAAPFRIVGLGGTATRAYLTTALLPEGKEAEETQPCFAGQLTERGFRQQVANGRYLRERYAEALGPLEDFGGSVGGLWRGTHGWRWVE
jgi:hypothetical protein